jgi:hypothetical protein
LDISIATRRSFSDNFIAFYATFETFHRFVVIL